MVVYLTCLYLYVALQWAGDVSGVFPDICPMTVKKRHHLPTTLCGKEWGKKCMDVR